MIVALLKSLRPKHWTKNLLVFAGYLFTIEQKHTPDSLPSVLAAFVLFCLVTGACYIYNDAADADRDRRHPRKCKRPIACGEAPVVAAVAFATLLTAGSLLASFYLDLYFGLLITAYFLLTSAYSVSLKHVVIVDLLTIAAGFVIRAVAGAVVVKVYDVGGAVQRVEISPWLLVCTTLLALFLGLAKRRSELVGLETSAFGHRRTLGEYTAPMLDQLLSITAAAALIAYCLYTFTPLSKTGAAHPYMMMTVPFVIYGLFRYLFLAHTRNAGASPEITLLEDKPLLIDVVLYVVAAVVALKL